MRAKRQESYLNTLQILPQDMDRGKASRAWPEGGTKRSGGSASLIKRVFEIDPLLRPSCGGNMKVKAFIIDTKEVKRLFDNLGIVSFIKPQKLSSRGPPEDPNFAQSPFPE